MSENIELSVEVEGEAELRPAGHGQEPLFHASSFRVTEKISRTYVLSLRVASPADSLDLDALLGRRVLLTETRALESETYRRRFHGVVTCAEQGEYLGGLGLYVYRLECQPALGALAMTTRCRIFGADEPRSLPEIVNFLLTDSYSGKAPGDLDPVKSRISFQADYKEAAQDYRPRDFVVQYNESDLNFLQRQLERYGVFYFFDPGGEAEQLIVSDYNGSFRYTGSGDDSRHVTVLHFVPPEKFASGRTFKLKDFVARSAWRPRTLTRYDYNYERPRADLRHETALDEAGEGALSHFGGNLMPDGHDEGPLLTERAGQLVMADKRVFTGVTDCFQLAAGFTFPMVGHFNEAWNSKPGASDPRGYLVTEVTHECAVPLPGESPHEGHFGHLARFTAIRTGTTFRPAKETETPRVPGPISASIDSDGDGLRADLDPKGRYLVHARFDLGGAPDGKHSPRLRLGQAYAGTTEGIGFPLRKGTEVMLGFVEGDIDRPVIQNAVTDPQHTSPVDEHFHTRSRLVTASAITLEMEDGSGEAGSDAQGHSPVAAPEGATGSIDDTKNWVRLYLRHGGQQSYLRLGAVPADEACGHVKPIGQDSLPERAGWLDYTEGDRASGTLGDATEIVGGKQRILVGEPDEADAAILELDAGRALVVKGGEKQTIRGGQEVTVGTGDQTIETVSGTQIVLSGSVTDIKEEIYAERGRGDQIFCTSANQYLYAGGRQWLECVGDQVYDIHGSQTGTVHGSNDIKYLGDKSWTRFSGLKFELTEKVSVSIALSPSVSVGAVSSIAIQTSIAQICGIRSMNDIVKFDKVYVKNEVVAAEVKKVAASVKQRAVTFLTEGLGVNDTTMQIYV